VTKGDSHPWHSVYHSALMIALSPLHMFPPSQRVPAGVWTQRGKIVSATSNDLDDDGEELLFLSDDDDSAAPKDRAAPWIVLIVDDDSDVHVVTKAVLSGIHFRDRPLEILSCYSGREACAFLTDRSDVAIVFLDVVMETDDAGLRVTRYIREELGNHKTRIILRTGQPGQAPEQDVITDYDINDYKSKTELTAQKLFTTLITALRSYTDLLALEASRDGLTRISDASAELFRIRSPREFIERTLTSLTEFVGGERGAIFCREPSKSGYSGGLLPLALSGWPVEEEAALLERVQEVAAQRRSEFTTDHSFLFLVTPDERELIVYLCHAQEVSGLSRELLELFAAKIGIGYDNVVMHEWLGQTNRWLEEQVQERTRELSEKTTRLEIAHRQMAEELKLAHILQQAILPTEFPSDERVEVTATMVPAHHVGGDFYHLLRLDENRLAFLIADVSGKGVPAAFFMLRAHALLNEIALTGASPAACLAQANRRLCEANPLMLFVTLFYGIIDTRSLQLSYATAGHDMPLWLHADGRVETLPRAGGMLLGTFEEAQFIEGSVTLSKGDCLFLYTDGFTEAMDGQGGWFGLEKLEHSLLSHQGKPIEAMMQAVIGDVQSFANGYPQSDDITCVLMGLGHAPS